MHIHRREENLRDASLPKRPLLKTIMSEALGGVLGFMKFAGLFGGTSIAEIEQGLRAGGKLKVERSEKLTNDPVRIKEWHLHNDTFSCLYLRSHVSDEVRETLHMVRPGMIGGAILRLTDGELVGGIVNASKRIHFSAEEVDSVRRILDNVRREVDGGSNVRN